MNIKDGVYPRQIRQCAYCLIDLADGLDALAMALKIDGIELIVTSIMDGKHASDSRHYQGRAADLRTRHLSDEQVRKLIETAHKIFRVKIEVGPEKYWYDGGDIVLPKKRSANQHVHVELRA